MSVNVDLLGTIRPITPTPAAEQSLREVAEALEISDARYESAERSYRSVASWLERAESRFAGQELLVYSQGSFRIGTPIRPANEDEKYDLDIVFENKTATKTSLSPKDLQDQLGAELRAYAQQHGMAPPERGRFCWTLHYADGAQFAMDVLPALPEGLHCARFWRSDCYQRNGLTRPSRYPIHTIRALWIDPTTGVRVIRPGMPLGSKRAS